MFSYLTIWHKSQIFRYKDTKSMDSTLTTSKNITLHNWYRMWIYNDQNKSFYLWIISILTSYFLMKTICFRVKNTRSQKNGLHVTTVIYQIFLVFQYLILLFQQKSLLMIHVQTFNRSIVTLFLNVHFGFFWVLVTVSSFLKDTKHICDTNWFVHAKSIQTHGSGLSICYWHVWCS